MKYFISYVYLTKQGTQLFGNKVTELKDIDWNDEAVHSIEKELENELDSRQGKLKLLYITKL